MLPGRCISSRPEPSGAGAVASGTSNQREAFSRCIEPTCRSRVCAAASQLPPVAVQPRAGRQDGAREPPSRERDVSDANAASTSGSEKSRQVPLKYVCDCEYFPLHFPLVSEDFGDTWRHFIRPSSTSTASTLHSRACASVPSRGLERQSSNFITTGTAHSPCACEERRARSAPRAVAEPPQRGSPYAATTSPRTEHTFRTRTRGRREEDIQQLGLPARGEFEGYGRQLRTPALRAAARVKVR